MTGTSADPEPLAGIDLGILSNLGCCQGRTKDGDAHRGLITPRGSYRCVPEFATTPPRRGGHTVNSPNGMPSPTQSARLARLLAKTASSGSLEGAKQALVHSRAELDSHKKKQEFLELQRKVRSCAGRKCDQIAAAWSSCSRAPHATEHCRTGGCGAAEGQAKGTSPDQATEGAGLNQP